MAKIGFILLLTTPFSFFLLAGWFVSLVAPAPGHSPPGFTLNSGRPFKGCRGTAPPPARYTVRRFGCFFFGLIFFILLSQTTLGIKL